MGKVYIVTKSGRKLDKLESRANRLHRFNKRKMASALKKEDLSYVKM